MFEIIGRFTDTRAKTVATAVLLVLIIGCADYFTGYEIAVSFFYLLPVLSLIHI